MVNNLLYLFMYVCISKLIVHVLCTDTPPHLRLVEPESGGNSFKSFREIR